MRELATVRSESAARAAQTIDEAFPEMVSQVMPLGNQVLVQMRVPKLKTSGGIIMPDDSRETDESMIRVAKVIAIGPIAYRKREDITPWPEGAWVAVGDFVRVPSYAGVDAWRQYWGSDHNVPVYVKFALFNDYDIKGKIQGDPLAVVDYI